MKIWIINGPNLNMLGIREPEVYGRKTYADLCAFLEEKAKELGIGIDIFQSNSEGELVTRIQQALGAADGIVINPAAYTHTSIAILDALKAVNLPSAEVHLSDVTQREAFRQISYAGMACRYHFIGMGFEGYYQAMKALAEAG